MAVANAISGFDHGWRGAQIGFLLGSLPSELSNDPIADVYDQP
jgi:hypothetical protein